MDLRSPYALSRRSTAGLGVVAAACVAAAAAVTVAVGTRPPAAWAFVALAAGVGLGLAVELARRSWPRPRAAPPAPDRPYLVPAELPPPPDLFVGRTQEIEAMVALTRPAPSDHARRILVLGPPGIGKTTTAIQFAYRVADAFPDGQLFGRREPSTGRDGWDAVLADFVRALQQPGDVRPDDRADLVEAFRRLTRQRRVLVVLDNVDTLADIEDLVPSGTRCLAVLTSRREHEDPRADLTVRLDALEKSASLDLLGSIVGPDRVRSAPEAAAAIVQRAGNLPLGVALTGATLAGRPHWDLELAAQRLDERTDEPAGSLDLTYSLLTEAEQHALVALGLRAGQVFAPWMLAALTGTDEPAAWTVAERLAQANLVERVVDANGVAAFHVLDQVHDYAVAQAAASITAADRADRVARLDRARRQRRALRAGPALQTVYALKDSGRLNEALDTARAALALALDQDDEPARHLALATLAEVNAELGNATDLTGFMPPSPRGLAGQAIVRLRRTRGLTLRRDNRIEDAIVELDQALDALDAARLPAGIDADERVRTLRERALARALGPHPRKGLADINSARDLVARDDRLTRIHRPALCWVEGTILDYADDNDAALHVLRRGLAAAEEQRQHLWMAWLHHGSARLALETGDADRCRQEAGFALRYFAAMQHRYGTAHCRLLIGRAYAREQMLVPATTMLEETLETLGNCDDRHLTAVTMVEIAEVRREQERFDEAARLLRRAAATMADLGDEAEQTMIAARLNTLVTEHEEALSTTTPPAPSAP